MKAYHFILGVLILIYLLASAPIFAQSSQTNKEKEAAELAALEAELLGINQKEDEVRIKEENFEKLRFLNEELVALFNNGTKDELISKVAEIEKHLKTEELDFCGTYAEYALINLANYYLSNDNLTELENTLNLFPDDCATHTKQTIQIQNLFLIGEFEEAKKIAEQVNFILSKNSLDENGKLTTEGYQSITTNFSSTTASRYLSFVSLVYFELGEVNIAIELAKAAIAFSDYTYQKEQKLGSTLSLVSIYISTSQILNAVELLNAYSETIGSFPWNLQVEYNKLQQQIASNKGDQSEEEKLILKNEKLKDEHKVVRSIDDRLNANANLIMYESGGTTWASDGIKEIIVEMERDGKTNNPLYSKAVILLATCYKVNPMTFTDPNSIVLEKLEHIDNNTNRAILFYYLGVAAYEELEFDAVMYLEEYLALMEGSYDKMKKFHVHQMLAIFHDIYEQNDEAKKHYKLALIEAEEVITNYYPLLTEKEQYIFNSKWIETLERSAFSFYARQSENFRQDLTGALLKFRLQTKGLILQNSVKTKIAISNSTDENLKVAYEELIVLKKDLSMNQANLTYKEKTDLIEKIETKEDGINNKLGIAKKSEEAVSIIAIQNALSANEYAIEVVRTQVGTSKFLSDTINYTFFIIPPKGEIIVKTLRDKADLENKHFNLYAKSIQFKIEDKRSYTNYWAFLEDEIPVGSTVFMSLDGIYNGISLNTLFNISTNKFLYERNSLVQISSLRDITSKNQKKTILENKSIFIGRPKYFVNQKTSTSDERGSYMTDLPGTEKEIHAIAQKVEDHNLPYEKFLGIEATEKRIKELENPRVLHIATHGYFKVVDSGDSFFDDPMLSSGLLLTGAGDTTLIDDENGILTAYEITSLNLTDTDLVILSACESGVGEGRDGQGIYGLSRAFIMAGSKSIISSLWKVDDTATQKYMELFYSHWLKNHEVRVAMSFARDELRKEYPHPYYWGAFVATGL